MDRQAEHMPELTPEQCRKRADECRRKAEAASDPASVAQYEELARHWRELADEAEKADRLENHRRPVRIGGFLGDTPYPATPCPKCGLPMSIRSIEPSLTHPKTDEVIHWCATCKMEVKQHIKPDR